ncbi:hypothetical protein DPMN_088538 [Dreissena polymorpha]|uniref:Uncharacterized protein n=1 Tax=Dreissena polymorpha TaxID=45954 RepID=A0A9D4QWL3_DREPO|nr:hypothetical protein DPMN_088538 [Dreissena polymorpha]
MPLALLDISLVFSALICNTKNVEFLFSHSTRLFHSFWLPARPPMSSAKGVIVLP